MRPRKALTRYSVPESVARRLHTRLFNAARLTDADVILTAECGQRWATRNGTDGTNGSNGNEESATYRSD